MSKAKAAKLVRNLVDMFLDLEAGTGEEVNILSFSDKISFKRYLAKIKFLDQSVFREYRMGKKRKSHIFETSFRSKQ